MTTSTKVQMSFLVNTMSTCQQKELNVCEETHVFVLAPHGSCRAPKFLVDPLEGPNMQQCGRSWNLEHDPTSSTRGGERGVLEVPGKTRKD